MNNPREIYSPAAEGLEGEGCKTLIAYPTSRGSPSQPGRVDRIIGDGSRRRNVGQKSSIRSPEPKLAVGLSLYLKALLVSGAATTEHREVRERGWPALSPVTDVMALAEGGG